MNEIMESLMSLHRCDTCPMRCQAVKKPRSIFARLHRWHMRWWPGWKIYQAGLHERKVSTAAASE